MLRISSSLAACVLAIVLPAHAFEKATADPELSQNAEVGELTFTVDGKPAKISYTSGPLGYAVHKGDIILGTLEQIGTIPEGSGLMSLGEDSLFGLAIRNKEFRWPNAVVKYRIDPLLPNPERVLIAIATWEGETRVRFEPAVSSVENQVVFLPGDGCSSFIGMTGGQQPIILSDACSVGNVIHEIGHALGLQHEQAREDHEKYIIVFRDNIKAGLEGNFDPDPTTFRDIGDYCYESIMHYPTHAFAKDPARATIQVVKAGVRIGQRSYLAECDKDTFKSIYALADQTTEVGFKGKLVLIPEGCQGERKCYLGEDITFTAPNGVVWKAGKREPEAGPGIFTGLTDGASIPDWAQAFIGTPFSDEYLLAAIVHDHYCYEENQVRGWRETHRMFYDALRALEVDEVKAKIMYLAVYLGGPKWTRLVAGESCGPNCVFDTGADATTGIAAPSLIFRPADYSSTTFRATLDGLAAQVQLDPTLSLFELDAMVQQLKPDDFFYQTPPILDVTSTR